MAKLKINEQEFFLEVEMLISEGYSISNAIKYLIKEGHYSYNFDTLRGLYYRVKRKESKKPTYSTEVNAATEGCVKEVPTKKPSFCERMLDYFRNLF